MMKKALRTNFNPGEEKLDFEFSTGHVCQIPMDISCGDTPCQSIEKIMETVTRLGGEMSRLRAEVDGLLEENMSLSDSFHKLREVLAEKGYIDQDEFELACEMEDGSLSADSIFGSQRRLFN